MTKEEITRQVIDYVDPEYYDVEGLINYLSNSNLVPAEVFDNFKIKNPPVRSRRVFYASFVPIDPTSIGYKPLPIEEFVRRIPLYFYVSKPQFDVDTNNLSLVASGYSMDYHFKHRKGNDFFEPVEIDYEPMYEVLLFMLYDCHLSPDDIFSYPFVQCAYAREWSIYEKWYKYLLLDIKFHIGNYKPVNLIFSLNELLERDGQDPIVYELYYDEESTEPYETEKNKIILEGMVPVNPRTGEVVKRWLGLWLEKEKSIAAIGYLGSKSENQKERNTLDVKVVIELNPDTKVFCLNAFDREYEKLPEDIKKYPEEDVNYWDPIYLGPKAMEFDPEQLKNLRSEVGLTQKELAEMIDVKIRTYQNWEMGVSLPDGLSLIKIMNVLGIKNIYSLIKRESILDIKLNKFRTGCEPSMFMEKK